MSRVRQYGSEKSLLASALINLSDAVSLLQSHLEVDEEDAIKVLTTNDDRKREDAKKKKKQLEKRKSLIEYLERKGCSFELKNGRYRVIKIMKIDGKKKKRIIGLITKNNLKIYVRVGNKFKSCKNVVELIKRARKEAKKL